MTSPGLNAPRTDLSLEPWATVANVAINYGAYTMSDLTTAPSEVWRQSFNNHYPVTSTFHFTALDSSTITSTWTWSQTWTLGIESKVKFDIPEIAAFEFKISFSLSTTTGQSLSNATSCSYSYTADVPVPPYTSALAQTLSIQRQVNIPWTATVTYNGDNGQDVLTGTYVGVGSSGQYTQTTSFPNQCTQAQYYGPCDQVNLCCPLSWCCNAQKICGNSSQDCGSGCADGCSLGEVAAKVHKRGHINPSQNKVIQIRR